MAYRGNSIVDYLKQSGKDSSYAARKKLAEQNGISGYTGTASQNTQLLNSLKNGGSQPVTTPDPPKAVITPVTDTGNSGNSNITGPGSVQVSGNRTSRRESYTPNDRVTNYYDKLQDLEADKPDSFESKYTTQIDSILDSILNREKFEYNMDEDKLYNYYRDAYMRQGQKAMRDTIGAASALSGGYGSSYAQTVGSQAYDQYLAGLNDKVPELYQMAYQKYLNEGAELYDRLGAVTNLDNIDYSRYRDEVSDYYNNLNYYNNRYNQEYSNDYGAYLDALQQLNWEEQFDYQKEQDALAQQNWQAEFDYRKQQDALEMALRQARASGGGRGRSGGDETRTYNSTSKYAAGGTANRSARDAILAKTSGGLTTSMGTGLTELIYPKYKKDLRAYMNETDKDGNAAHSAIEADKRLMEFGVIDPEERRKIIAAARK